MLISKNRSVLRFVERVQAWRYAGFCSPTTIPWVRSFVEATLKAREYLVVQANDGVDAIEVLLALGSAVDLLITDIKMPRMDGVALARAAAEMFPAMPVLFISGWADPIEEPEWQRPQYAFLRKPFLPKVLINSIEGLRGRSARRAAAPLTLNPA
jgi:two-component system cell cycle sensor histidine kinase/response regulator CckA